MYLIIMKAKWEKDNDTWIPNAVGIFRLSFEPVKTMVQIIRTMKEKPQYIRRGKLIEGLFTGPELLGLANVDDLELNSDQEHDYYCQDFVVVGLPEEILEKLTTISAEQICVTAEGQQSWLCALNDLSEYEVFGPPLDEWKAQLKSIKRQEIAEACKKPLSWKEARRIVMNSGTDGVNIAMWLNPANVSGIKDAIRVTLKGDRGRLSHIEQARLEATLKKAEPDGC
ncbi:MAG: hypothetical protein K8R77_01935 [Anaerolineaceae bacterium]|nr:hypothetical protein [Anaerolineaceae bacterium]